MENSNSKDSGFVKWLDVILAIAGDKELPASKIAEILGTSKRNAYYLLKTLGDCGFVVRNSHGLYSLDISSPFFKELFPSVSFSKEQVAYLYNLLGRVEKESPVAGKLKLKLQDFYHLNELQEQNPFMSYGSYKNVESLRQAIRNKNVVLLHGYASSNSQTVKDRMVEPYMFLGDDMDIRAYEMESGKNKTFKLSRIGSVEILSLPWANEDKHRDAFTDMFMFTGEVRLHVTLRLDFLAHNLMLEEHPKSEGMMTREDDKHWLFKTDVANYVGIGRFILGLYDRIDVLGDLGLKLYLKEKVSEMKNLSQF